MAEEIQLIFNGSNHYEQFSPVFAITLLFSSILFFEVLLYIVKNCRLPSAVDKSQSWRWANLCVSLMHAAIVAVWGIMW